MLDSTIIAHLKSFVGRPYTDFDEGGNYIGCFEPLYLIYETLPKYHLPQAKKAYFAEGFQRILENFDLSDVPQPLDVIVFSFGQDILHIGVLLEAGKFFHVQRGSTFEVQRIFPYRNKIIGYYKAKSHLARKCLSPLL